MTNGCIDEWVGRIACISPKSFIWAVARDVSRRKYSSRKVRIQYVCVLKNGLVGLPRRWHVTTLFIKGYSIFIRIQCVTQVCSQARARKINQNMNYTSDSASTFPIEISNSVVACLDPQVSFSVQGNHSPRSSVPEQF